jgi:hypothetical protein
MGCSVYPPSKTRVGHSLVARAGVAFEVCQAVTSEIRFDRAQDKVAMVPLHPTQGRFQPSWQRKFWLSRECPHCGIVPLLGPHGKSP